jgi:hypothetical protein
MNPPKKIAIDFRIQKFLKQEIKHINSFTGRNLID